MPELEYARVLELMHERRAGWVHIHAILTGWRYSDLERIRTLVVRHGFGRRYQIEPVRKVEAVGAYVASAYLLKSRDAFPYKTRVIQYSRGWAPRLVFQSAEDRPEVVAAVPDGMTWTQWADREIGRGQGERIGTDTTGRLSFADENPLWFAARAIFADVGPPHALDEAEARAARLAAGPEGRAGGGWVVDLAHPTP
jgi:hypothetical protein